MHWLGADRYDFSDAAGPKEPSRRDLSHVPDHLTGLGAEAAGRRNPSPARTIPFRPTAELM